MAADFHRVANRRGAEEVGFLPHHGIGIDVRIVDGGGGIGGIHDGVGAAVADHLRASKLHAVTETQTGELTPAETVITVGVGGVFRQAVESLRAADPVSAIGLKTVPRIDGVREIRRILGGDAGLGARDSAGVELDTRIVENLLKGGSLRVHPSTGLAVGIGLRGISQTEVEREAPLRSKVGNGLEFVTAAATVQSVIPANGHIAESAAVAAVGAEVVDDVGVDERLNAAEARRLRDRGVVFLRLVAAEGDVEFRAEGDAEAVVLAFGDGGRRSAVVDGGLGKIRGVEGLSEVAPDRDAPTHIENTTDRFRGFFGAGGRRVEVVLEAVAGVLGLSDAGGPVAGTGGGGELRWAGGRAGGVFRDVGELEVIGGGVGAVDEMVAGERAVAGRMVKRAQEESLVAIDLVGAVGPEKNQALLPKRNRGGRLVILGGGVAERSRVVAIGAQHPKGIVAAGGAGDRIDEGNLLHLGQLALALVPVVAITQRLGAGARDEAPCPRVRVDRNHIIFARTKELLIFNRADDVGAEIEPTCALRVGDGKTPGLVGGVDFLALRAAEFIIGLQEIRVRRGVGEQAVDINVSILITLIRVVIDEAVAEQFVHAAGELNVDRLTDALVDENGDIAETVNRRGIRPDVGERTAGHPEGRAGNRGVVDARGDDERVDQRTAVEAEIGAAHGSDAVDRAVGAEGIGLHHAGVAQSGVKATSRGGRNDPRVGADTRGAEGGLAGERGRLETGVDGLAVPSGERIVQRVHPSRDLLLVIVADHRHAGVSCELDRERGRNAATLGALPVAVSVGILPRGDDAGGNFALQRVVGVDRGTQRIPRAILGADLGGVATEASAFDDRIGGAADCAGAKQARVGAAGVVHTLEVVGRGIGAAREEIAVNRIGPYPADRAAARAAEELTAPIIRRRGRTHGPVDRFVEVADIERIEKLTGLHRIGDGSLGEIAGEATAGERTGGNEALITGGVHLEGRELDRRGFLLRREGHRGRRRLGEARSGGNKRGGKPNHGQTRRAKNKAR